MSKFATIRVPLVWLAGDYHKRNMRGQFTNCVYDTKSGEVWIETLIDDERAEPKGGRRE